MNARPKTLFARLVLSQIIAATATYALTAAFAPRVLLLLPSAESAALDMLLWLGALSLIASLLSTVAFVRPLAGALRSLANADGVISPNDVLGLHALPIRLVFVNVGFAIATSLACSLPSLRPHALDAYPSFALGLLLVTLRATACLPEYVTMRASVTRTLELASVRSTREALRQLRGTATGRVRRRFVAAVTAPVAFVALGASLLVDAHVRAYDRSARAADAVDLARAVFELPSRGEGEADALPHRAPDENLEAAQRAARAAGFDVQFEPSHPDAATLEPIDDGEGRATLSTSSGSIVVTFGTSRPSPVVLVYALLAFAAVAIAAILGTRTGGAFEADVVLATHEVRRAGVADVMRGTIIHNDARFAKIDALLHAIDALGGVFREFASAQERAIDARAATERMRGLLLASMSHDLKAPLNAVLGFAELVGRNPLSDGQRESLAIIEERGRELLVLIDTILDSARVEVGELEFAPSPTDMADVVMSAVLEARALAVAGTAVPIKVEIQPGIPDLFVDGMRVVQALTAVLLAAARFSERGAVEVRATLSDTGDRLRVEVEGSGEGLPASDRDKIFDAFESAASARRHGALGLGLQLARSIMEIHGGGVDLDDVAAPGMLFRLWLPIENDSVSIRERASRTALPESD